MGTPPTRLPSVPDQRTGYCS